jgi:parvulin-like peptidyl-prolyl isomerase
MSKILEDEDGFHIVRVIERQDAGTVPFEEVQPSIKEKLQKERAEKRIRSYVEELRQKTLVWSILDEQAPAREQ